MIETDNLKMIKQKCSLSNNDYLTLCQFCSNKIQISTMIAIGCLLLTITSAS